MDRKDAAVVATHKTLRQAHTHQRSTSSTYHIEDKDLSLIKRKCACYLYTDFDYVNSHS